MGRRQTIGLVLVAILVLGGLFQNCGSGANSSGAVTQTSNDDSAPIVPGRDTTIPLFKAGDRFDETKLPYSPGSGLVNKIKANYKLSTNIKAIAMAQNGYGVVVATDASMTSQDEVSAVALERCQLFSGNRACVVVAEGNSFKYSEEVLYQSHKSVLETGARTFNPFTIPGLSYVLRQKDNYLGLTETFKAYAIGPDGAASAGWSSSNQAEANRRAFEFCESLVDQACTLYAVGNDVVFNVISFSLGSTKYINYGPRAFSFLQVPFVRDIDRSGDFNQLAKKVAAGEHAVAAISRFGQYFIAYGSALTTDLETTALNGCNATIEAGSGYQCFIYSKDQKVVFTRQSLLGADN